MIISASLGQKVELEILAGEIEAGAALAGWCATPARGPTWPRRSSAPSPRLPYRAAVRLENKRDGLVHDDAGFKVWIRGGFRFELGRGVKCPRV